jgi:hypothetical protein
VGLSSPLAFDLSTREPPVPFNRFLRRIFAALIALTSFFAVLIAIAPAAPRRNRAVHRTGPARAHCSPAADRTTETGAGLTPARPITTPRESPASGTGAHPSESGERSHPHANLTPPREQSPADNTDDHDGERSGLGSLPCPSTGFPAASSPP